MTPAAGIAAQEATIPCVARRPDGCQIGQGVKTYRVLPPVVYFDGCFAVH